MTTIDGEGKILIQPLVDIRQEPDVLSTWNVEFSAEAFHEMDMFSAPRSVSDTAGRP